MTLCVCVCAMHELCLMMTSYDHRMHRYSMVVEDGVVTQLNVEPDGTGLTCSLSSDLLNKM